MAATLPDAQSVADEYRPGGWNARYVGIIIAMLLLAELGWLQFAYPVSALPEIATEFQTSQAVWVSSIYFLVGAMASPITGMLADRFGKRRVLTISLVITTVGLLISAFAPNFALVLVGRFLQAPVLTFPFMLPSLARDIFPTKTIPMAASLATTGAGVIGVPTLLLAGPVVSNLGWRATFWIPAIVAVVVFILLLALVPESSVRQSSGRVDVTGAVLFGGGVALVLVGVSFGPIWGWASATVIGAIILGLVVLVAWVVQAGRAENPIVDLRALVSAPILLSILISGIGVAIGTWFMTVLPTIALTPAAMGGLGVDVNQQTQFASVYTLGSGVSGFLVGWALRRRSGAPVFAVLMTALCVGFVVANASFANLLIFTIAALLLGMGGSGSLAVAYNMIIRLVVKERQASMASAVALMTNVLTSVASVVLFAVMNGMGTQDPATGVIAYPPSAFTAALMVPVGFALLALLLALLLHSKLRGKDAPSLEVGEEPLAEGSTLAPTPA